MRIQRLLSTLLLVVVIGSQDVWAQKGVSGTDRRGKHQTERKYGHRHGHIHPMDKENFKTLLEILEKTSFDDRKKDIVLVACMGNYFTGKQCERLLSCFSFETNKLEALEIISPRLTGHKGTPAILKQFSFSTNKDKAIELLTE